MCWGKAAAGPPTSFHPALLHMLDVAAVALELLADGLPPAVVRLLKEGAGAAPLADEELALLVACHDLGKVSPGFQAKVPELYRRILAAGVPKASDLVATDHGRITYVVLPGLLATLGAEEGARYRAARAVAGHHGSFPRDDGRSLPAEGKAWTELRSLAFAQLRNALEVDDLSGLRTTSDPWTMALAGFTTVADWVGSDIDRFPYQPTGRVGEEYVKSARARARSALDLLGWLGWPRERQAVGFRALFPPPEYKDPNPVQAAVEEISLRVGPGTLILIEAPTGSGKTEASLVAAQALLARGEVGGIYYALPTQATSNQMFGRLRSFLERRYDGQRVNLHLLHGLRDLQDDFRELRPQAIYGTDHATVVAEEWFLPRKRSLLAPFAVGTIDQALLAVLQCKHFFVRQLGLAGKVVVLDEVHAYDTYMSTLLDRLLGWLSVEGASVILLSATLPTRRRTELLQAWGGTSAVATAATGYPRVSYVARSGAVEAHVLPWSESRSVGLRHAGVDSDAAGPQVLRAIESGGCVAWICNTVGSAQAAYRWLEGQVRSDTELMLFHARFPVGQRLEIERRVLAAFGKGAGGRPGRAVLVATQVVEQSLDLDFDFMVSDLAPIDLLLQRAGRLHRHLRPERPANLCSPQLGWVGPAIGTENPDFGASSWIYEEHVLLRTWLEIRGRTEITLPESSDRLLASVYDDGTAPSGLPIKLQRRWDESRRKLDEARRASERAAAQCIVPRPGLSDDWVDRLTLVLEEEAPEKHRALRARTREIDETIPLVCLARRGDQVVLSEVDPTPVHLDRRPGSAEIRALALRTVTVTSPAWVARLRKLTVPSGWTETAALRHSRALVFEGGLVLVGPEQVRLDPVLGLVLGPMKGGERPFQRRTA